MHFFVDFFIPSRSTLPRETLTCSCTVYDLYIPNVQPDLCLLFFFRISIPYSFFLSISQDKKLLGMADTAAAVPLSQVSYTELRHFATFYSPLCTLLNESFFQGAGYGVVIGLGALFALGMIGVTEVIKRRGNVENSEEFTGK